MSNFLKNTTDRQIPKAMIGVSEGFLAAVEQISRIAPLQKPVLIVGERGTGKELFAERLHLLSERWDKRLIKFNCAAVNDELLESELFGHVAGAFTGAVKPRSGRFELADGGTLFLDEVASMSLRMQEKLLRVIEYGEFQKVGASETHTVDVRLVAAANVDLPHLVQIERFRADLLDRLAFDVVTLPPLRYRADDILVLAERFAEAMTAELKRPYFAGFSAAAGRQLQDYHWPGNVRELKNVIERAVYQLNDAHKKITHLCINPFESPYAPKSSIAASPVTVASPAPGIAHEATAQPARFTFPMDLRAELHQYERSIIGQALITARQNQTKAAELLGLNYHQLRAAIKKYGL